MFISLPGSQVTAAKPKIHPKHIEGRYRRLRSGISFGLQALLFALPWLNWEGRQAVLCDVEHRRLFLFGLVLHPQDTYFLHLLLISAALTMFFVSAVAGRMWCGYACPETIFTQSFIMVERWWEGDRAARQRLDKGPWNGKKFRAKFGKWAMWTVMGGWLGLTFAGYYTPIRHIGSTPGTIAAVIFFAAISLFFFGYFREQFCIYICPYSRFQSVMIDRDSLIVGYDALRGEPRGKKKKLTELPVASQPSQGDCVDCSMCVQVCPMGIDIRNGLQMECIHCTACIDACDSIMDKVERPRGLIRYTSLNGLEKKKTRLLRPRVLFYAALLSVAYGTFGYLALTRKPLAIDAVRLVQPGGQLAATTADGRVSNTFKINLMNRLAHPTDMWISVEGLDQAELLGVPQPIHLESGQVFEGQALVVVPASQRGVHRFQFRVHDRAELSNTQEATLVVP